MGASSLDDQFGTGSLMPPPLKDKEKPSMIVNQQPKLHPNTQTPKSTPLQQAMMQNVSPSQPQYDGSNFNKSFEQERKISALVNELKKQQMQQQQLMQQSMNYEDGYFDKLASKKKDVSKFIQSGLIILFAISLHFIVDFLLKHYLQTHDVSFEREVWIRVLYPVAVLFLAWNIIAFVK
jgi:hypothetical protein